MIPVEPDMGVSDEGLSRRRMLKRIGAGAAVAWSAPILTSIKTPAFAASAQCVPFDICGNGNFCGPSSPCGPLPPGCPGAGCTVLLDNSCLCWDSGYFCDPDGSTCQSDAECVPGYRCGRIQNDSCVCQTPGDNTACWHPCGTGTPGSPPPGMKVIKA